MPYSLLNYPFLRLIQLFWQPIFAVTSEEGQGNVWPPDPSKPGQHWLPAHMLPEPGHATLSPKLHCIGGVGGGGADFSEEDDDIPF